MSNKLVQSLKMSGLKIQKHSPEILAITGAVGVVASAVLACKATLKADTVLDELHDNVSKIKDVSEKMSEEDYSENDYKKDMCITYGRAGIGFLKLYGPSIALGVFSLGCMFESHHILNKRNVALAAAYATVDRGFKEYRKRVVDKYGKEEDIKLLTNTKTKKIETEVVDKKTGKTKKKKEEVEVADGILASPYARFFDEGSPYYEKDAEHNLYFLKCQQNFANDKLQEDGFLFLNDVYEMLGIPRSKAGQMAGWIYDKNLPIGDNYIDFGIYDVKKAANRDFVNGYEKAILLDFNVDGNILDLMERKNQTGKDYSFILDEEPYITSMEPWRVEANIYDDTKPFDKNDIKTLDD